MDPIKYLNRFHANFSDHTLENIAKLQRKHLQHVPFENLDVIRKVPIYLNVENSFKKIVTRKRGGYCYEVNGLFHWALKELGFQVRLVAATVKRPNGKFAKANTHVAIIANLDQPYLVDVGFGDSNYEPIPLDGTAQTDISGTYKVKKVDEQYYDLTRKENSSWKTLYRFTLEEKQLADFHEGIVFNQVSPQSTFTHHDIVTMATEEGRITLRDQTLITTVNGERTETDLEPSEKLVILQELFGINL